MQVPPEQVTLAVSCLEIVIAASEIFGIPFYDSVIAFEKRRRVEPLTEWR